MFCFFIILYPSRVLRYRKYKTLFSVDFDLNCTKPETIRLHDQS